MMEQEDPGPHSLMEIPSKIQHRDQSSLMGTLEISLGFVATKQTTNQEKATLRMIGNFVIFFLAPAPHSPSTMCGVFRTDSLVVGSSFITENKERHRLRCSGLSEGLSCDLFLSCLTGSTDGNSGMIWIWGWRLLRAVMSVMDVWAAGALHTHGCLLARDCGQRTTKTIWGPEKQRKWEIIVISFVPLLLLFIGFKR